MKTIDLQGNSINEIIARFRLEYKIKDWELKYEVISQASKGFLGIFGKKQAALRFHLLSTEERIRIFVEQLMEHMGIKIDTIKVSTEQKTVYVDIKNIGDAGFLIGKNGNMLEQLQYLVNRVFENVPGLERIYLDTEDYRYRQEQNYLRPFITLINKVKATGKPVTLEPMQAGERRIIHKYVEQDRAIKTLTVGEGEKKRIVIMPAGQNDKESHKPNRDAAKPIHRQPLKPNTTTLTPNNTVALKPKPEPKADPKKELTPEEKAQLSYKRHNQAHHNLKTAPRPNPKPTPRKRRPDSAE